jgi:hypothetical protein
VKRAIERHLVFPLANLVATSQVKLGDFVRVDMASENQMIFVKEAEKTMAPVHSDAIFSHHYLLTANTWSENPALVVVRNRFGRGLCPAPADVEGLLAGVQGSNEFIH